MIKRITIVTLRDSGLDHKVATRFINRIASRCTARCIQVLRPTLCKGKMVDRLTILNSYDVDEVLLESNVVLDSGVCRIANRQAWLDIISLCNGLKLNT